MEPQELRGPRFSPDPFVNAVQYRGASPRMTARGREPFLRIIRGTGGDPLRDRLPVGTYPKRGFGILYE